MGKAGRSLSSMKRASVESKNYTARQNGGVQYTSQRLSVNSWLDDDEENPILYSLSGKTARLSGLQLMSYKNKWNDAENWQEGWQVGVYGPGGFYIPHEDAFSVKDRMSNGYCVKGNTWVGNRIATIMFYLSELPVGGATVFPKLRVAAKPRRGTAVFWYNLFSDGTNDARTLHGACPTALGIKWVTNRWVREAAQLFRKPCRPTTLAFY